MVAASSLDEQGSVKSRRVLAAMSGGVDSSVAAALLKDAGFEVIGVTMQVWPEALPGGARDSTCCSLAAVEDARQVAHRLGIPHYVLNFAACFEREVISDFAREYARGRTPNPCIRCNEKVKFRHLFRKAMELGADFVATGHYARIRRDPATGRSLLVKARDAQKDQTYVLYRMRQPELAATLFPIGGLTKEETRRIASDLRLPVAEKPESQEICFIPDHDYRRFLRAYLPEAHRPGYVIDLEGNVVGEHEGIAFYTIGQRKGIGVSSDRPLYVVELDPARNAVIVGHEKDLLSDRLFANEVSWILFDELSTSMRMEAKIRYAMEAAPGWLVPRERNEVEVRFDSPQRAVTPGQSVVMYCGDVVIGGGIIQGRSRCFAGDASK